MKNETKAIHLNFGQGTNFDIKVPWVVGKSGFTTNIAGTFMMLDATTNMDYRKLLHCETLEMNLAMKYAWRMTTEDETGAFSEYIRRPCLVYEQLCNDPPEADWTG